MIAFMVYFKVSLIPRPHLAFYEKSGKAWYHKSRDRCHNCVMLRSQKVSMKLELFYAIHSLQAFILCRFGVYNDRTSSLYMIQV